MDIQEELEKGLIIPKNILNSSFKFLRPVRQEEKEKQTRKGYTWYICSCGNIIQRRNDIETKECSCQWKRKTHLTFQEKQEIVNYYLSKPMKIEVLEKKFNISYPTAIKILQSFKIKEWNKSQIFSPNLKEDYFHNIDTEKKAYFLGLIITDGNIYDNYKSPIHQANVNITLQKQDKYLLETWKEELNSNKQIASDGRGCYQLAILSTQMKKDLEQYKVTSKKTFSTFFPFMVDRQFYRHILRGIIDGDGSIGYYAKPNKKRHTKYITLCSANKAFLEDINNLLFNEFNFNPSHLYQEKESLWSVKWSKKEYLRKLIHWLYDDSTIFMKRKKEKCDLILQEIENTEINNI